MKTKIIIAILALYTIVISVLFVINGKKLTTSSGVNVQHELKIDSLKSRIKMIEERPPLRDKSFDSIGVVLRRISLSLEQIEKDKKKIRAGLSNDLSSLSSKSIDSLKIIALKD